MKLIYIQTIYFRLCLVLQFYQHMILYFWTLFVFLWVTFQYKQRQKDNYRFFKVLLLSNIWQWWLEGSKKSHKSVYTLDHNVVQNIIQLKQLKEYPFDIDFQSFVVGEGGLEQALVKSLEIIRK